MSPDKHKEMVKFIWSICNLLRGPYKRNEYRKVILPLTVLRRFDCILAPTKEKVLTRHNALKGKSENIIRPELCRITKTDFYNLSKLDFNRLLDDPNHIAQNLNSYINAFSPNVRQIMERFEFGQEVLKMAEKNLLYEVVKAFCSDKVDLSLENVDNMGMGYVFEELIRIGAEQSNLEAGDHFTPREVIELMVNLLLSPEEDLAKSHVVKKIYDPACGTGGMLSTADKYIRKHNAEAKPILYGQDWNDGAYAVCKSDMLINGSNAENIKLGCVFTHDGFEREKFDYMLANPPFGVEWKQQQRFIEKERDSLGYEGRFGAGIPRINDGALLFLQHMISKMNRLEDGGSRIAIVFSGSPLFTGDAGGGESEIRRWIIENDWLEAIVSLPEQLFYNTGISTYIWIVANRKEKKRKGKIQLIDAQEFYLTMKKSLGNKRREIGNGEEGKPNHIADITKIYDEFKQNDKKKIKTADGVIREIIVSKIFDNEDFGYHKITVERPLRLNFQASVERIARLDEESGFANLVKSQKKREEDRLKEIEEGKKQQGQIRKFLGKMDSAKIYKDRKEFLRDLQELDRNNDVRLSAPELQAVLNALSERDETAEICTDKKGNPEADSELRDTENIPLKKTIEKYFEREVKPYVPDAWIDYDKTKIGYEIPMTRHFYVYEPPRPLEQIETDIKGLEKEIVSLLANITGSAEDRR
jgi:type I restriction enzyme M protein